MQRHRVAADHQISDFERAELRKLGIAKGVHGLASRIEDLDDVELAFALQTSLERSIEALVAAPDHLGRLRRLRRTAELAANAAPAAR